MREGKAVPIASPPTRQYSAEKGNSPPKDITMTDSPSFSLSAQDCLVALMVAVSASDEDIRTAELIKIQSAVNILPIFAN
jgi:uncharacterized membrane protein YebE (DUF533 family)